MMKKKILSLLICICAIFSCSGCGKNLAELPKNPIIYTYGMTDDAERTIESDGKVYTAYGTVKGRFPLKELGKCLGYVEDDKDTKIYELNNCDSKEYIVEYLESGEMDVPFVWKEISAKNGECPKNVELAEKGE